MDETRLDKIEIKELEVFANHGVYPEENVLGQKFVISATLFTRTRLAGLTDELSASINYGEVSHMITDFTRKHTYKLLESLAENLAEMLLCSLSGLEKITLKIEKPWAPVGLPLKTVSVEITRKWHTAYIAFGSNMGDKKMYIDNGIRGLAETKGCRIEAISDYLITEPYGVTDQDEFFKWSSENADTSYSWRIACETASVRTGGKQGTYHPLGTKDTGSGYPVL